jgi:hypothetical protein
MFYQLAQMHQSLLNRFFTITISVLFLLGTTVCYAQTPSLFLLSPDTSFKSSYLIAQVETEGSFGSNSIPLGFTEKLAFGGHLGKGQIQAVEDRMSSMNRAGGYANGGFSVWSFSDTLLGRSDIGLRVHASTHVAGSLHFSRDFFSTVFRGNAVFEGDTAHLGPMSGSFQGYRKFGVGLFRKRDLSSVSLSLVTGQAYQELNLRDADLITSSYGDSLSLSYTGDYWQSNPDNSGGSAGQGLGVCLDLDYNVALDGGKGFISVAIRDLGMVRWHSGRSTVFDSLSTWQGLQIDDLILLNPDSILAPSFEDSIHYEQRVESRWKALPASVHLRLTRKLSERHMYDLGLSIFSGRAAVPFVHAGFSHFIGQRFMISERLTYGGFGRVGVGLELQWMPKSQWLIQLRSQHAPGWIFDDAYSRDLRIGVAYIMSRKS